MSSTNQPTAPVSGTCKRCGCELGYVASLKDEVWYCCGACAGSNRCSCGCRPELARPKSSDTYVPTRRMFASRHPDGLRTPPGNKSHLRAFPFADPRRGR
jgi:hypothetical protein